jgi:hypothetical protein
MTRYVGQVRMLGSDRYGAHLALLTGRELLAHPTGEFTEHRDRIDNRLLPVDGGGCTTLLLRE